MKQLLCILLLLSAFIFTGCVNIIVKDDAKNEQNELEEQNDIMQEEIDQYDENTQRNDTPVKDNQTQIIQIPHLALSFSIPSSWQLQNVEQGDSYAGQQYMVYLHTDETPYQVVLPLSIAPLADFPQLVDDTAPDVYASDTLRIKEIPCAPAIACFQAQIQSEYYLMNWGIPQSSQPMPENIDGIWVPSVKFNKQDALSITSTFRKE